MATTQYGIELTLAALGIEKTNRGASTGRQWLDTRGDLIESVSPVDGEVIASVTMAARDEYEQIIGKAGEAFASWRQVPAPKRGEIVRQVGEELRKHKQELGTLVSWEMGKSIQEEVGS